MRKDTRDNVARFSYDCGKVSFAVMIIGVIVQKPFVARDLIWGIAFTLTLLLFSIILNEWKGD